MDRNTLLAVCRNLKVIIGDYEYSDSYKRSGLISEPQPSKEGRKLADERKVESIGKSGSGYEFKVTGNHGVHSVIVSAREDDPWIKRTIENGNNGKNVVTVITLPVDDEYRPTKLEWAVYHFCRRKAQEALSLEGENASERIVSLLENLSSLLIIGPTGCGKTYAIREAAAKMGWELIEIAGSEGLSDSDLLGSFVPRFRGEGFLFSQGLLSKAFRMASEGRRAIFYLDEINRLSPKSQNLIIQLLNPRNGEYRLFNYLTQKELIAPAKNIRFISAINVGAGYSSTSRVDIALMRRFESVLFMDYMTPDKEAEILSQSSGLDEETCTRLVRVAGSIREAYKRMELQAPLDTGSLISWARLLKENVSIDPDAVFATAESTWIQKVVTFEPTGYPTAESIKAVRDYITAVFGE